MSAPSDPKPKKEESGKKRKSVSVDDESPKDTTAPKVAKKQSTKSSKHEKEAKVASTAVEQEESIESAPLSAMEGVEASETSEESAAPTKKTKKEKSSKEKKDKSSKKRKAATLVEDVPETTDAQSDAEETKLDSDDDEKSSERPSKKRKASVDEIEVDITAPEPPSKKALRRLKKGKPLPPPRSGAENTPEPEEKKEKKEVEKRSEHGIWIGNLPWSVSKEELKTFFVEYSDLTDEMITRVHMPGPDDGKSANKVEDRRFAKKQHNKGFAYVDFSTAEAVDLAVELSEQLLSGRRVLIKNNKSFEGRPQKTKEETRAEGKPPSKRVFLGNLRFDTTEESLKEHFEKCGAVESVKVATFEDSGKCKGYAWIVFEELASAESAVRGFVRIEEETSDQSDSESEAEDGSDSDAEAAASKKKPKKAKLRKVWVNRIQGRPLRMEFAEDAQVRYKKRYGKEGTKRTAGESGDTERVERAPREEAERSESVRPAKVVEYRKPYAARLTGGIVESKGKKTTF
ncbi:RNA recognition domain-containing protein [Phlyctema vagabunda]|uniref:RNA recognition domain-containing protein n=1 Tax=Phlyctema vagabunda TaxID=108571 RepID=A0ABR4PLL9_9HELO